MMSNTKNFLRALKEVSNWCHMFRPDCKHCPLCELEEGVFETCLVTGHYIGLRDINLNRTGKILSEWEKKVVEDFLEEMDKEE